MSNKKVTKRDEVGVKSKKLSFFSLDKIVEVGFIICLVVLYPLGEVIRFTSGNGTALVPLDIGILVLLCVWLPSVWLKPLHFTSILRAICIFLGICILSLILNPLHLKSSEILVSSLYIFRWVFYASIFLVVSTSSEKAKKRIPYILLISGSLMVLGGFLQFFFYPALRNLIYLGWDEHYKRMFGSFLDPNFLGVFFNLFLVFVVGLLVRKRWNRRMRIFLGILAAMTIIAIMLTFSRGAYIMFVAEVLAGGIVWGKRRAALGVVGGMSALVIIYVLVSKNTMEGMNLLRQTSTEARFGSAQEAIQFYFRHPLLGVGFDTYRYAQHQSGLLSPSDWLESHAGAGTDNSFLFVLATTGIIGFMAYLYLGCAIVQEAWMQRKKNMFGGIVLVSLMGLLVNCFTINSLFYPFIMLWIWILIGLL